DLTDVVRTAVEDYRSVLEDAGARLEVVLPDQPIPVEGDATRLAQVVGNVLHNASKFTDSGGTVTVQVERVDDRARLIVRGTGIGLDGPMLSRLFEAFSQADHSLDRSRGGLGLGLALVKGLVDLHGGVVRADSAGLGQGTSITISLPTLLDSTFN